MDNIKGAFIWDTLNGMRNLKYLFENEYGLDLTDWHLRSASAISADGLTIAGTGINPDGYTDIGYTMGMFKKRTFDILISSVL